MLAYCAFFHFRSGLEERMTEQVNNSEKLKELFMGKPPNILLGKDYTVYESSEGKPIVIGEGTYSIVFLGIHNQTRKLVGIKMFTRYGKSIH